MFGIDDVAVAALGSAAIGGLASWWGQDDANKANRDIARETNMFNAQQAQMNRDWQERMSNTSYQRAMSDMKAAGLNPMLAYSQVGASVPTGAQAVYPGAVGAQYKAAEASATSAQAATTQAETAAKVGNSTVEKIKAEVSNVNSDTDRLKAVTLNLAEERQNLIRHGWNLTEVGNHLRAQVEKIAAEIPNIRTHTFLQQAQSALAEANTGLATAETQLRGFDIKAASDLGNLGRESAQLAPILKILVDVLRVSK